jgi:hypothetical protein
MMAAACSFMLECSMAPNACRDTEPRVAGVHAQAEFASPSEITASKSGERSFAANAMAQYPTVYRRGF